ncbi:MAG: malto-oligosyltrehalose trehalohydrolase [Elusimicrobia bacterium]|nr:malto-oligosyltrehalose trehalohydrolase [Elusimicrobiota bacterium]
MSAGALALPVHGARHLGGDRTRFCVWAPAHERVDIRITAPYEKSFPLQKGADGFFLGVADNAPPGTRYLVRLGGDRESPDPASLSQPDGVSGASEVVESGYDAKARYWMGLPLADYALYELHVGTFTPEGTFDAAARQLSRLKDLGVTAVEVMPVAQFPGTRNWGYDGVFPSAAQNSYGGPEAFRRFVDACHERGMAVVLDVVYNHLGPEGCVLAEFGPYFTDRYRNPWGHALNFDGPHSDAVRAFFIQSALWWVEGCGVDALRLDATSTILDLSERPFLAELAEAVSASARRTNRLVHLIAEHLRNDGRVVRPREMGGLGLDAQWSDDFHHALHALLTGETAGYYADFGTLQDFAQAYSEGWVHDGTRRSAWRGRTFGTGAGQIPGRRFVVYWQNHDQVGNRSEGARAGALVSLEAHKLALGATLLSPYLPMLFMGDEHGARAPFHFFADFSDAGLRDAVRTGRARELKEHFGFPGSPPDPFDPETFQACVLEPRSAEGVSAQGVAALVRELLRLRREHRAFKEPAKERVRVRAHSDPPVLCVERGGGAGLLLLHFGEVPFDGPLPLPTGRWRLLLDSADARWAGAGAAAVPVLAGTDSTSVRLAPKSFALYEGMAP